MMTPPSPLKPLIFRDNSAWLRYVFLGGALGMCVLVAGSLIGTDHDIGKIIGGILGVLLLGFSGYVLQVRQLVINPLRQEVTVTSKGLARTVTDRFTFDEVAKLLLLPTYEHNEELLPTNRRSERWSVVFVLKDRTVPATVNPYPSKEQAMQQATRIQQLVRVDIYTNLDEGLAHLAHTGKTIDAVVAARQHLGMTLGEAKDHIDQVTGRRKPTMTR